MYMENGQDKQWIEHAELCKTKTKAKQNINKYNQGIIPRHDYIFKEPEKSQKNAETTQSG